MNSRRGAEDGEKIDNESQFRIVFAVSARLRENLSPPQTRYSGPNLSRKYSING